MRVCDSHVLAILGRPAAAEASACQARSLHVGSAAAAGAPYRRTTGGVARWKLPTLSQTHSLKIESGCSEQKQTAMARRTCQTGCKSSNTCTSKNKTCS